MHQRVTYEHFLPDIIGKRHMRAFDLNLLEHVSFKYFVV